MRHIEIDFGHGRSVLVVKDDEIVITIEKNEIKLPQFVCRVIWVEHNSKVIL